MKFGYRAYTDLKHGAGDPSSGSKSGFRSIGCKNVAAPGVVPESWPQKFDCNGSYRRVALVMVPKNVFGSKHIAPVMAPNF